LGLQTYQFVKTERDKNDASDDAKWFEAVKTVSQSGKISPIVVTLNPFLKSKSMRYADLARREAVQVLFTTHDKLVFTGLFKDVFVPIAWKNLDEVLQLNRTLGARVVSLYDMIYKPQTNELNKSIPFFVEYKEEYDYILSVLPEINQAVASLLKGARPQGQELDLRSVSAYSCDLNGTNLYAANIENINLQYSDLKGADLGGITSFTGAYLYCTPWWEAKRISPELLDYLIRQYPYDATAQYGTRYVQVPQKDYEDSISRLRNEK
jgi:hypothetical protein